LQKIGGHVWQCRNATNDHHIILEVVEHNCYRLPPRLGVGSVVVDVGAHVGAFSVLALDRGAFAVFAFEADPGNAALAREHLAPYGERAQLYQLAVVRSDAPPPVVYMPRTYPVYAGLRNTGGNSVFGLAGEEVDAIALDELLALVDGVERRGIDVLKLDCEGSEFPLLLTSRELARVRTVVGEFHEFRGGIPAAAGVDGCPGFTRNALARHLADQGFAVELVDYQPPGPLGLFFARRPPHV
jgi:FkbM family methyltransferase